jgi:CBS-domain-containing membrane protein
MNRQDAQKLQPNDFVMALQEMGTLVDVTVEDLMQLCQMAEKYARKRNRESMLVDKLMTQPIKTVHPDCSLSDAAHLLVTDKISGLPVVDDHNKLIGIITEADFLRVLGIPSHHPRHSVWQTLEDMFSQSAQVREPEGLVADIMMNSVITISTQHTLHHALDVMKQNQIKRLIVCDEDRHVVGMITRSDLVRVFFDRFNPVNKSFNKS